MKPRTSASAAPPARRPCPTRVDLNALQRTPTGRTRRHWPRGSACATSRPARVTRWCANWCAAFLARGVPVTAEGVLEMGSDPFGFLRWPEFNFLPCPEDLYVPAPWCGSTACARVSGVTGTAAAGARQGKIHGARPGDGRRGHPGRRMDRAEAFRPTHADVPEGAHHPGKPAGGSPPTVRAIDLIATLGRGQRGLILAPPRDGQDDHAQAHRQGDPRATARRSI